MDFNLYNANLSGKKLIEASAGTGKTFTLSGLYVRYIVEKKRMPEQILVLTFTKAATFELKTRLRDQLIECKNHLTDREPIKQNDNPQLFELYQSYKLDENSLKYIDLALACFDQAAIFTINSFCQKIIVDYNRSCGSPVFSELIDKKQHVKKFVLDFWRLQQNRIPAHLLSTIPNIDSIAFKLSGLLSKKHYRDILPKHQLKDVTKLDDLYQKICQRWNAEKSELLDYMFSGNFDAKFPRFGLKSHSKAVKSCSDELDLYLETFKSTKLVERFTVDFLENSRKSPSLNAMPEFFSDFQCLYGMLQDFPLVYIYECWQFVQEGLAKILSEQGMYGYDDQINIVHQAVMNNSELQQLIAKEWQTIMVDEFQDTDLLQLEIFEKCFDDGLHDIIYVGDPKQAIYDFRGADVFVYEQAKQGVDKAQRFNLATNWRSSEQMLATTNAMFDFNHSFKFDWLQFQPSLPKPKQNARLIDGYPPVAIINGSKEQRNVKLAQELKRFTAHARIESEGINQRISRNEIAILVKSNAQATELYNYLLSQNINVSLWSEAGVFTTEVAQELYYLIRAIAYPSQNNIFTSLHGIFFSLSLNELQQSDKEELIAEFISYRLNAQKNGLSQVLNHLFQDKNVYSQLLQRIDGERQYTDVVHLIQLIQEQSDFGKNTNQIAQWLAKEISNAEVLESDETAKRRLESDGHKIAIMTMHKSKGLEFDCVFIPYADVISDKVPGKDKILKAIVATHDKDNKGVIYWHHCEQAKKSLELECSAEVIRTLYVALTRAKHRIYLGLDYENKNFTKSPISKLYEKIANNSAYSETLEFNQEPDEKQNQKQIPELTVKQFNRIINKPQSIYSFSSLSRQQEIGYETFEEKAKEGEFSNYFHFPRGAASGTMQHTILENINFKDDKETISHEVKKQLLISQYNSKWNACLTQQMYTIVNTPLFKDGPKLSEFDNTLDEMEFLLPVKDIKKRQISAWLTQHRNKSTQFNQENLQGYLTGFIDLIFEHDNKFYVVDYKSNTLGFCFKDYNNNDLKEAIEHHYYDLQYLLYCVALIKYLITINPEFDYHENFGGVCYLFTRGINGETGQGIYKAKPEWSLIQEMLEGFNGK